MSDGGSIHKMFLNSKNDSTYGQLLASGKIDSSITLLPFLGIYTVQAFWEGHWNLKKSS